MSDRNGFDVLAFTTSCLKGVKSLVFHMPVGPGFLLAPLPKHLPSYPAFAIWAGGNTPNVLLQLKILL